MTVVVSCACCSQPSVFPVLIDRDGLGVGPKVAICGACDLVPRQLVWARIAQPSPHPCAFKPVHAILGLPTVPEVRA